jgi:hypothetical protein
VHFAATPPQRSTGQKVNQLGRTIVRWSAQIATWHRARVSNGQTEAVNNLVKRVAFGFRRFAHYRIRALLYAGKPKWALLAMVTPAETRSAPLGRSRSDDPAGALRRPLVRTDGRQDRWRRGPWTIVHWTVPRALERNRPGGASGTGLDRP